MIKNLNAVLCVLLTPFTKKDKVDVEGLRKNVNFLIEKAAGRSLILVPTGSMGEFYALSDDESKLVIKTVVDEANGKLQVIAGTAKAGTKETLRMCKYAEDIGADGVMVVLPYYHIPDKEGMYNHYKKIAENIDIGVMVYNNSDTTKCFIPPSLMARISEIPGIIGDKENTKSLLTYYRMTKAVGDKMPILCGVGEFWFYFEAQMGCPGFVTGIANFAPELSLDLLEAANRGDFKEMWSIANRLMPIFELEQTINSAYETTTILPIGYSRSHRFIGVRKEMMNLMDLNGGKPRLPITPLNDKEKQDIRKVAIEVGLILP